MAQRRRSRWASKLATACHIYLDGYDNVLYDIETNGELDLMRAVSPLGVKTVFDVGANRGEWAAHAVNDLPDADIHCFEVVPDVAAALRERFSEEPRVQVNPLGLAEVKGRRTVTLYEDSRSAKPVENEGLSSIVTGLHETERGRIECEVTTGDAYMHEAGLGHIDFLKIDVEGAEGLVLQGFSGALADGRIEMIQFEYSSLNIVARTLLLDLYELLEGYSIGKIYPRHVEFRPYGFELENFRGPNFLAVRNGSRFADALS